MAYTTPITWVAGAILTAAQLNQQVRDNTSFLAVPNMCRARSTATTSIPNSATTVIPFAAADSYDTAAMHSTTVNNSRVIVNLIGVYSITGQAYLTANATGQRILIISKNGAEMQGVAVPAVSAGIAIRLNITLVDFAASATDFYELGFFQDSGGALPLVGGGAGGETASLAVTYMGATA